MLFSRSAVTTAAGVIVALIGFGVGFPLASSGFSAIQDLRLLDRLPVTTRLGAVLPGDAAVRGVARSAGSVLRARHTGTDSLYYRYLHEVETRDSDGDKRWKTRTDHSEAVDFLLEDDSGRIRVPAQRDFARIDFSARQRHQVTQGSNRYTEWRIEPGDAVVLFGTARTTAMGMEMGFRASAGPPAVVSGFDADTERRRFGRSGVFRLWGGLALLAFGVLGLALALRIHRVLAYLTLLTLVLGLTLLQFGVQMTRADLEQGAAAQAAREAAARARFADLLDVPGSPYREIEALPSLNDPRFATLAPTRRANLQAVREELEAARQRLAQQFRRFPERLLAPLFGVAPPQAQRFLPAAEAEAVSRRLAAEGTMRLTAGWVTILAWMGLLLAAGASWVGFGGVRLKRWIENLPTSKTSGAACGLTELSGEVVMPEDEAPLEAPLSYRECVWYEYKVEEKRQSGKKTSWRTIEQRSGRTAFLCRDSEGAIRIEPEDAEIISRHHDTRREGRLRYTERRLEVGDACYALGPAVVHGEAADRLCLRAGELGEPFLLSNYPERIVMLRKAFFGLAFLNLALTALTLGLLLLFATAGSFSPADFLLAALAAPLYMTVFMLVLHYNDLLFLRERARRNWSNIQVSLRKRRNLVRPLNTIVGKYLEHERSLQEALARLRTELRTATDDPGAAARYLAAEQALEGEFRAVIENYPKLRGAKAIAQLTTALTRLENEIALMRAGYNDAVEHYNARIDTFPDLLFARFLEFVRLDYVAL
ncbi:MAG: LemA family protein [Pseudomonadales bacterium]|nr:LemA family protein [Pseudomonadales bacterium]